MRPLYEQTIGRVPATNGASTAAIPIAEMKQSAANASRSLRNRRHVSCQNPRLGGAAVATATSLIRNPRIDGGAEDVGDQSAGDDEQTERQREAHDERIVPVEEGVEEEAAHARP